MTLTSLISHKNPTLGKLQMAQSRRKSIAQCSWAYAASQSCSWCCNFSSVHFWRGDQDETMIASGRRRDDYLMWRGNRMSHGFILFPELCQQLLNSCCVLHLSGFRMLGHVPLDLWGRTTPSPMTNVLQMNQRGWNILVSPHAALSAPFV